MTIEEQITAELDEMLLEQIKAEQIERDTRRAHDDAVKAANEFEARAQKLRLALYRLAGEKGEHGDANADNSRRRNELRRGDGR